MSVIKQFFTLFAILSSFSALAQVVNDSDLYKTILSYDSLLFEAGFNECDVAQVERLLSSDLRFYHDKNGISGKAQFIRDLRNGLCSNPANPYVTRALVAGSTQIFPLYRDGKLYGAVQNGEHTFAENGPLPTGIAKFTSVWQLEKGEWKLVMSVSFDHRPYVEQQK